MIHVLLVGLLSAATRVATSASDAEAARIWTAIQPQWEHWSTVAGTFRRDGADPGAGTAGGAGTERFELLTTSDFPNLRRVVRGRMVPATDPLASAQQLVEVRLNDVSYDYIRAHNLYSVEGQRRAVAAGPVAFPVGAIQLKAGWRPISSEQRHDYHTLTVRLADGHTRLFGLVAVNFAVKTPAGWLWASIEHVAGSDDASAGAPWSHYRLRGTQTDFLDAAGQPVRLANAELEAGLGESASCMTCHARASIGVHGAPGRLPVFAPGPPGVRRGYVGVPERDWFGHRDAQGHWQARYVPLDCVWSLAKAAERTSTLAAEHGP